VLGDPVYGAGERDGLARQFLHSARIGLDHPRDGARLEFESELPDDLREALEAARAAG